ncbi:MAG: outer membrane beta-barrel protein [Verrucomicrobia bacterium]|nr:outer membrane beta-barrel protein [Verrucomicrobiota bacterium]
MKAVVALLGVFLLTALPLRGQGLLGIGQKSDYKENVPFKINATAISGYDHINYADPGNTDVNSPFAGAGLGFIFAKSDRITEITTGGDFDALYYFDKGPGNSSTYYNARANFNIQHAVSRRLTVSDNLYAAYEIEPDFNIGVSNAIPSGQYFYGYNNFAVSYAWTERFATTATYTFSGIKYQDDNLAQFENRLTNIGALQFSYKLNRRTSLTAEYRFEKDTYPDSPNNQVNPDYTAHYLLVGVDQAWSPTLAASARVGAEFYDSERTQNTAPYLEASLNLALSRHSSLRWYNQLGYNGSQVGAFDARYSYSTGVIANYQFSEKFTGNIGLGYVYSNYEASDTVPGANENQFYGSLGMNYKFNRNLSMQASYSFTTINSDISFNEYDRHYTTVGLNASF